MHHKIVAFLLLASSLAVCYGQETETDKIYLVVTGVVQKSNPLTRSPYCDIQVRYDNKSSYELLRISGEILIGGGMTVPFTNVNVRPGRLDSMSHTIRSIRDCDEVNLREGIELRLSQCQISEVDERNCQLLIALQASEEL